MKKKFLILVLLIGLISVYVNLNKKDLKVNNLEKELGIQAQKYAEEYFNKDLELDDFDISLGEEVDKDKFENVKNIHTQNKIYFVGHHKNKPEDIIKFILVYDKNEEKILEFGLDSLGNEKIKYIQF